MDMDMVRSWKDPWGRSTSLGPSEASTVLTNLCGRSRPVGPMLALYANATVVLTLAAGLVWVNGSFGCRTIAARTRDLILHMLPAFTSIYRSYLSVFKESH